MTRAVPVPQDLRAAATAEGWSATEILWHNPRKSSFVARVESADGQRAVAKWLAPDAPEFARQEFRAEQRFYAGWSAELPTPAPLRVDGDLTIVTEFEGARARDLLVRAVGAAEKEALALIEGPVSRALDAVAQWTANGFASQRRTGFEALLERLLVIRWAFARSGPLATRRLRRAALVGRALELGTRPLFRRSVNRLVAGAPALLASGSTHGDLHLDNVLVSDQSAAIIDFGTWVPDGPVACDAAYFIAAGMTLLSPRPTLRAGFVAQARAALRALPGGDAIIDLAELLETVGRQNPRFNPAASGWTIGANRLRLPLSALRQALWTRRSADVTPAAEERENSHEHVR